MSTPLNTPVRCIAVYFLNCILSRAIHWKQIFVPYISVNRTLKIDLSAHSFSEHFTENRLLLLHFQWINSLKIDSGAQSFSEPFTENSFYGRLQAVQNAAARLVSGARRRDSVSPILRILHWLPVRWRVMFKSAVIAWKCVNGVAPTYLRELCVPMEDVHSRPRLRSASTRCILLPRIQTSTGQRSFAYSGPTVWNSLPPALRENMSLATFKTKLKSTFSAVHNDSWRPPSIVAVVSRFRRCDMSDFTYLLTYLPVCFILTSTVVPYCSKAYGPTLSQWEHFFAHTFLLSPVAPVV